MTEQMAIDKPDTVAALFERYRAKMAQVTPRGFSAERLVKVALNCCSKVEKLRKCTPASLISCMMTCAELGLEPGGAFGQCYLVPFEDRKAGQIVCTFILGYQGMLELARRSGQILDVEARIVHEGDEFRFNFGLKPELFHRPKGSGAPTHAWFSAHLKSGRCHFEVMTWAEIMKIKATSKSKDFGPWKDWEEEMAKKTVMRRGYKWIPRSEAMSDALEKEEPDTIEGQVIQHVLPDSTRSEVIEMPKGRTATVKERLKVQDARPEESNQEAFERMATEISPEPGSAG